MIESILLFGSTGDLAGRLILPALASLQHANKLPEGFRLVATSRRQWDDQRYHQHMIQQLDTHASHIPTASREALVATTTHIFSDLKDEDTIRQAVSAASGTGHHPIAVYMALPPGLFASLATTLDRIGLPAGSRLVVEKPFGEDLDGAIELNRVLDKFSADAGEEAVFRVDHVLGMATVHNLMGLRLANPVIESIWNSTYIQQIDVLWEETLALEGRAGFYDKTGALKDVLQNHMIQVLCYAAMEKPKSLDPDDIQDRKVDLLNAITPFAKDDVVARSRRARYTAGTLAVSEDSDGREVPNYVDEHGVDAARDTETLAEVVFEIENDRWRGTRFVLRTGKALAERHKEVVVHFQSGGNPVLPTRGGETRLEIGIDGPFDLTWRLNATLGSSPDEVTPLPLASPPLTPELPPYAWVLLDVLGGGTSRSVRGDEAEAAWRIVKPILDGWAEGLVPMDEYAAGSDGPQRL